MDLARAVNYRGLNLNGASPVDDMTVPGTQHASRISGIQLDEVIIGAVPGIGYTEKRSQADGRDASDVYLDGRRFQFIGTVYGPTAAEAHDMMQDLRSALTPTAAYTAQPGSYGFLPLDWYEPTADSRFVVDPDPRYNGQRYRHLFANVRPTSTPEFRISRDRSGGRNTFGIGFPFQAQVEAKDPRLYLTPQIDQPMTGAGTSGSWTNRGDYPSPLNIAAVVAAHAGTTGRLTVTAGGSQVVISMPPSGVQQIYRYDGTLKILTLEENSVESLRMDLFSLPNESSYPLILPGTSAWSWSTAFSGTGNATLSLIAGSHMWFWEAFA